MTRAPPTLQVTGSTDTMSVQAITSSSKGRSELAAHVILVFLMVPQALDLLQRAADWQRSPRNKRTSCALLLVSLVAQLTVLSLYFARVIREAAELVVPTYEVRAAVPFRPVPF